MSIFIPFLLMANRHPSNNIDEVPILPTDPRISHDPDRVALDTRGTQYVGITPGASSRVSMSTRPLFDYRTTTSFLRSRQIKHG